MAKKKSASKKKSGSKKGPATNESMIILLPKETYDDYVAIRDNPELDGPTIEALMTLVFGNTAMFGINAIEVGSKESYVNSPVTDPQPRKC